MGADSVLVTGGAGFVGSELVTQLISDGHRVVVLDNLQNGRRVNLAALPDESYNLVVGDVRDAGVLAAVMSKVSTVFHLACLGLRHSLHAPQANHDVNVIGTLTVLNAARAAGVHRFVHVSSSEVYGSARWVPMSEDHPTEPSTVYGATKLAGESYARAFHRTYGLPVVIVRPFNAFGPRCHHEGDSGEVIPRFLLRALAGGPLIVFGDGEQTRDFTFVTDTARGIRLAATTDAAIGETVNLGSGRELTVNELARTIKEIAGRSDTPITRDAPRPGDVRRMCADSRRAQQLLRFAPTVDFEEGLSRTLNWYRSLDVPAARLLEAESVHNWLGPGEV